MNPLRSICAGLLLVCSAALSVSPQQSGGSSPETPAAGEKPRTPEENRKRLEQLACGPPNVHFSHHTDKQPGPLPQPSADKALIYVLRSRSMVGAGLQARLGVDAKWVGVNRPGNYFYLDIDPGPHNFCVEAVNMEHGLLSLIVEKGKTYFLQREITMTGTDLEVLDLGKAQELLAKYRRSIFEEKSRK